MKHRHRLRHDLSASGILSIMTTVAGGDYEWRHIGNELAPPPSAYDCTSFFYLVLFCDTDKLQRSACCRGRSGRRENVSARNFVCVYELL